MSTYYLSDFEIGHSIFLHEDLSSYGVLDTNVVDHPVPQQALSYSTMKMMPDG
jgi:hypothetical protein